MDNNLKVGICFGGYCPMHQGHLDIIMRAKKENDVCYVVVCGYDNEQRANEIGLTLKRRYSLVKKLFKDDEQVRVLCVNDTELGIDESQCSENWDIWYKHVYQIINSVSNTNFEYCDFTWYVGEREYQRELSKLSGPNDRPHNVVLMDRINPVSGTLIRRNPIKYWNKIAWTFRPYFSTNILVTGTASEGKSTLVRDISTYFSIPYSEEYGRTYLEENAKNDTDLSVTNFQEFLIEQRRDTKNKIESRANNGIVVSDTDNLVTLMYAKAYVDDDNIDITEDDYETLKTLAANIKRGITWDKIFLLPPKNEFVDDGVRYMKQASINERTSNYNTLVKLLKEFDWWDNVVVLKGNYLENFNTVKEYIEAKIYNGTN